MQRLHHDLERRLLGDALLLSIRRPALGGLRRRLRLLERVSRADGEPTRRGVPARPAADDEGQLHGWDAGMEDGVEPEI